jgi:hypothetical protein
MAFIGSHARRNIQNGMLVSGSDEAVTSSVRRNVALAGGAADASPWHLARAMRNRSLDDTTGLARSLGHQREQKPLLEKCTTCVPHVIRASSLACRCRPWSQQKRPGAQTQAPRLFRSGELSSLGVRDERLASLDGAYNGNGNGDDDDDIDNGMLLAARDLGDACAGQWTGVDPCANETECSLRDAAATMDVYGDDVAVNALDAEHVCGGGC